MLLAKHLGSLSAIMAQVQIVTVSVALQLQRYHVATAAKINYEYYVTIKWPLSVG